MTSDAPAIAPVHASAAAFDAPAFSGTYDPQDVEILLNPVAIEPTQVADKERLIQSGERHYSEMLSAETIPDERYLRLYHEALERNSANLKTDIVRLAEAIANRPETARECVVISLARAGTPIGVLLVRQLRRMGLPAFHYSISIIRDRGIDENALRFIKQRHSPHTAVFVDGWTGKGAIVRQLVTSLEGSDIGFKPFLAVVADPAGCANLAATTEDYVIPSGLLNGIVSGLISRSVLNDALVGPDDFHACQFMSEHANHDISRDFIAAIEAAPFLADRPSGLHRDQVAAARQSCEALLANLMEFDRISDVNRIKLGVAEATRAILRRVPEKLYLNDLADPEIQHMIYLAEKSGVPIIVRDLSRYRAVVIIKSLGGAQE